MTQTSDALSIHHAAQRWGTRAALEISGETISFASLSEEVRRIEDTLQPSSRLVAVLATPSRSALQLLYACLAQSRPILLLHPRWPASELKRIIAYAQPDLVFLNGTPTTPAASHSPPALFPTDQALLATSGSTGSPKLVCLPREAILKSVLASNERVPLQSGDRWLLSLPFAHIGGLSVITRCLAAGATCVVADRKGDLAATLIEHRVTHASLVPTQLRRLLRAKTLPRDMKSILVGGAALSPTLEAQAVSSGLPVQASYGLTEMGSQVATRPPSPRNTAGATLPLLSGVEARLNAAGSLEVRGSTRMRGYLGFPPLAKTAWVSTADRALLSRSGELTLLGRTDNVIISGGENINPEIVEQALDGALQTLETAAVGVPDPEWGQRVVALIVPSDPTQSETLLSLKPSLHSLPAYATPKELFMVPNLPRLPSGKLDRARCLKIATQLSSSASLDSSGIHFSNASFRSPR